VQPPPAPTADLQGFEGRVFQKDGKTMPYRLWVPENYDPGKAYPLVLYLHHAGLVGTDNCIQLTEEAGSGGYGGVFVHQATAMDKTKFATQAKYPHFLVAPQATNSNYGFGGGVAGSATAPEHATRALVYGILDALSAEFKIDPRRRYVTGISMGCYGTWDMIMRRPDYFAGASPQSCRGDPNQDLLAKLVEAPIWSMCGTNDSYFAGAKAMADAMTAVGAKKFVFTPFQGVGHSIHNLGYDYPGFIDWLFAQSLPGPVVEPGAGGAGASGGAGGGGAVGVAGGGGATSAGAANGGAAFGGASLVGGTMAGGATNGGTANGVAGSVATLPTGGSSGSGSQARPSSSSDSSCALTVGRQSSGSWTALGLIWPLLLVLRRGRRR
jgi:dienelactone hydrolase